MAVTAEQRRIVAQRARHCCEYCQSQLRFSVDSFSVEHIVPCSRGGTDDLDNLGLACQRCNNHKFTATQAPDPLTGEMASFFHPREQSWHEHFLWSHEYLFIRGLTPTGRATVERLQLNRSSLVNLRRVLVSAGEHPPIDTTE